MKTEANSKVITLEELESEVVVCGGGLSGLTAAVSAARHGAKVVLIQDRPVLGGNASSEMRMGIMGAHGDDNKEAGLLEELQLRNIHVNPLMRYTVWDDVMLSMVLAEGNITLRLNTSVNEVVMDGDRIAAVRCWNSTAYKWTTVRGRIFIDATGDGILRLSGAKYRIGRELPEEFGETFLSQGGDYKTMGNSILLQLRKTDIERPFIAPDWAYKLTDANFVQRKPEKEGEYYSYRRPEPHDNNFWWIEYGGEIDTVGDANEIQLELKKMSYGVWAYIKNHPDGRGKGYELDWIGAIPGKRESTRFIGPKILTQHDITSGGHFDDVVAYGGWSMDDHMPAAFWHEGYQSVHHSAPSPYGIPFDSLYSVNVPNLMFAGRDISVTHIALSSTRVMGTCATIGQAVGTAAALEIRYGLTPASLRKERIAELQTLLEDDDCMLPYRWRRPSSLTLAARAEEPELEVLRNGIDRGWAGADNGIWIEAGDERIAWYWERPVGLSGARIIFDSEMTVRGKRMRKLEATTELKAMPAMLAKRFRLEARVNGEWKMVYEDCENFLRFRKIFFQSITADALRLIITETWGGGKAHVFAFDSI